MYNKQGLHEMLLSISSLKKAYDIEREKNRFNVFTALHKENAEEGLHSRFISYLLSPKSGHGMEDKFLKIFVEYILKLKDNEFDLSNCEVYPNEQDKREFENIDILLINKNKKQAIIIENKIDAKDSNRQNKKKDGYDGQLERYYNTIKKGYCIEQDGGKSEILEGFQCDTVFVYYLTKNKPKQPSFDCSLGCLKDNADYKGLLYYSSAVLEWLDKCMEITPKEISSGKLTINEFINQYKNLIKKMTNNDALIPARLDLKNELGENWENTKYLFDNFKHVKWHTVHEFWTALKNELKDKGYSNIRFYIEEVQVLDPESTEFTNGIDDVTHNNKNINHGVLFDIADGKTAYISGLYPLSWGIVESKSYKVFYNQELERIDFSNFSTENSFRLINYNNMKKAVSDIVEEIKEEENNKFMNLKKEDE